MLDAMRLLDRLEQAAAAGGRMGSVIEIAVLQALALQTARRVTNCRAHLLRRLSRFSAP